jgi:hypothetical protein
VPNIVVVAQQTISATTCNGIDSFRDLLIEQVMGLKWYDDQVFIYSLKPIYPEVVPTHSEIWDAYAVKS